MLHLILLAVLSADPAPPPADNPLITLARQEQKATEEYTVAVRDAKMAHDSLIALNKQQAIDLKAFHAAQKMALERSGSVDTSMFDAKAKAFAKLMAIRDEQDKLLKSDGRRVALSASPVQPPVAGTDLPPPPIAMESGATTPPPHPIAKRQTNAHVYLFSQDGCPPCREQEAIIRAIQVDWDFVVREVDVTTQGEPFIDGNGNQAKRFTVEGTAYSVSSTPILIVYRGGQEVKVFHGLATEQQILEVIK